jgi:hypothetical protein
MARVLMSLALVAAVAIAPAGELFCCSSSGGGGGRRLAAGSAD